MNSRPLYPSFLVAAAAALFFLLIAFAAPALHAADVTRLAFSDPARPGTLKIHVNMGDLQIRGTDAPDITVQSDLKPATAAPRPDGLRVLTTSSSYSLSEKDNIAVLEYGYDSPSRQSGDFQITVPRHTTLLVSSAYGGDARLSDLSGDIEIKSMNGEIHLDRITGGALVETMNGEIFADVAALRPGKPLSFTTMNGAVQLRVPADARANLKMRTQNGAILTDFDEQALVTRTQSLRRGDPSSAEIQAAVREGVRVAREAALQAARVARDAARAATGDDEDDQPEPPAPPPPLPPMTGGKLVSGALNGGGVDINITTMNGDITLRKLPVSK